MSIRKALDCLLLAAAVAVTRFVFRSRYLYDLDSVNFALALESFDTEVHQPHPPGYYLYVWLGRLAHVLIPDANAALVAVSIAGSIAAAAAIYALADAWFGRRAAVFAGLIFLFSPLCWFHGIVALTYILELFFSALVGWLCWQIYMGRAGFVVPAAVALAAAAGVRQSTILFLGPLWLFALTRTRRRYALAGVAVFVLGVLAWMIPMAAESGGIARYFTSLYDLWGRVPSKRTAFSGSFGMVFATLVTRFTVIAAIYALCFGAAGPLALLSRKAPEGDRDREKVRFTWVWVGPALVFFTLIFLNFVNSGYLLVAAPPVFAWAGARAAEWSSRAASRRPQRAAALAAAAAVHAAIFLYSPLYCSYRSVRLFEADLAAIQKGVRAAANPADTLIVSFDSHFLGYRHAGYYLPEYWTVQYPEVSLPAGPRIFAMRHNRTRLLTGLPEPQSFLVFPLPQEQSFTDYLDKLRAQFPDGSLRTVTAGGREFLAGSSAQLDRLFPKRLLAETRAAERVYASTHPAPPALRPAP